MSSERRHQSRGYGTDDAVGIGNYNSLFKASRKDGGGSSTASEKVRRSRPSTRDRTRASEDVDGVDSRASSFGRPTTTPPAGRLSFVSLLLTQRALPLSQTKVSLTEAALKETVKGGVAKGSATAAAKSEKRRRNEIRKR